MIRAFGKTAFVSGDPVVTQFLLLGPVPVPIASGYRSDAGVFLPLARLHPASLFAGLARFLAPVGFVAVGSLVALGFVSSVAWAFAGALAVLVLATYASGRVDARERAIREASQPLLGVAADLAQVDSTEAERVAQEIHEVLTTAGVLDWRLALVEAEKQDAQRLGFLLLRTRAEIARAPEKAPALEKTTDQLLGLIAKKQKASARTAAAPQPMPLAPAAARPASARTEKRRSTRQVKVGSAPKIPAAVAAPAPAPVVAAPAPVAAAPAPAPRKELTPSSIELLVPASEIAEIGGLSGLELIEDAARTPTAVMPAPDILMVESDVSLVGDSDEELTPIHDSASSPAAKASGRAPTVASMPVPELSAAPVPVLVPSLAKAAAPVQAAVPASKRTGRVSSRAKLPVAPRAPAPAPVAAPAAVPAAKARSSRRAKLAKTSARVAKTSARAVAV